MDLVLYKGLVLVWCLARGLGCWARQLTGLVAEVIGQVSSGHADEHETEDGGDGLHVGGGVC